jgi:hypothetical protein
MVARIPDAYLSFLLPPSHFSLDLIQDMVFLEFIFETYPDAMIIQTHRHPSATISAWCETVKKIRTAYSNQVDKREIGKTQLKEMKEMVESVQSFRAAHPELADRFIDVKYPLSALSISLFHFVFKLIGTRYNDLLNKPYEAMINTYKQLNIELSEKQIYQYLSGSPALIPKLQEWIISLKENSKVPISLDEFGLDKEQVEESFTKYIQHFSL